MRLYAGHSVRQDARRDAYLRLTHRMVFTLAVDEKIGDAIMRLYVGKLNFIE